MKWGRGKMDFSGGCVVMGILNVTPDSFSDGGEFFETDAAIKRGIEMAAEGAAIIDIGAESTRPGAETVSVQEQIKRAIPVIKALAKKVNSPHQYRYVQLRGCQSGFGCGGGYHK